MEAATETSNNSDNNTEEYADDGVADLTIEEVFSLGEDLEKEEEAGSPSTTELGDLDGRRERGENGKEMHAENESVHNGQVEEEEGGSTISA